MSPQINHHMSYVRIKRLNDHKSYRPPHGPPPQPLIEWFVAVRLHHFKKINLNSRNVVIQYLINNVFNDNFFAKINQINKMLDATYFPNAYNNISPAFFLLAMIDFTLMIRKNVNLNNRKTHQL